MSLKEKFNEIEEMTALLSDLVDKQTEGFEEGLEIIYRMQLVTKVYGSMDGQEDTKRALDSMVNEIKGSLLLAEEN